MLKNIFSKITGIVNNESNEREYGDVQEIEKSHSKSDDTKIQEFQFTLNNPWSHKLFCEGLSRKYKLKPYRYRGQKYSSVVVKTTEENIEKI